jgi:hypothetical protein
MKQLNQLSRSEMKNVIGGVAAAAKFSCTCTGSVGAWTATYSSATQIANDIVESCSSGQGSCTAVAS